MKTIWTGLAMALLAVPAIADDTGGSTSFTKLDMNGDGRISRAEAAGSPELTRQFKDTDADGDGSLNQGEFDAWLMSSRSPGTERNPGSDKPKPGT